ncbi:MAG: hypothetical protein ACKVWV_09460 [Planctomycetota bacterium]
MQPFSIRRDTALALLLTTPLTASLGGTSHAQERVFAPIAASDGAKTAPEMARPFESPPARPIDAPAAVDEQAKANSELGDGVAMPAFAPSVPLGVDHTVMHYDAPGDGSLWARGAHYKASFDETGATYYPLFSSQQPRHYPLTLSPDVVTLDGQPLAFERSAPATRTEHRIEIDRGAFVETYELAPESIEQLFVFRSLPSTGDLVVRVPIASELAAAHGADGFEFRSEFGHVSYGRAVAIDAEGRRVEAPTELQDGSISIRVDRNFLATAALPLVIDPVVSTFPIDDTTFNDYLPDVAYDATTQRWLVVFEERAAGGDNDVYYHMCNAAGSPVWGGYVNVNNASWDDVKCANLRSATQFLAVSSVDGSGSREIRGRTIEADISAMSNEFFISGGESGGGPKRHPSVGGDPYPSGPAYYCVAYEREYDTFADYDILVRLVGANTSVTAPNYLSNSGGTRDEFPSVSKSNGGSTWMISWERHVSGGSNIWGGRIRFDGLTLSSPFQITAFNDDIYSSVSSPLIGSQRTMVAYMRDFGTDWDIVVSLLDGATVVQELNLSTAESTWFLKDQGQPSVDTDGQHFLVAYHEEFEPDQGDYDVFASDLRVVGNSLQLAQTHMTLGFSTSWEGIPRMASAAGSGGPNKRFMVAFHKNLFAGHSDIMGALVDTYEGGTWSYFCKGDGSAGACPCGNNGFPAHGCANSANAAGALVTLNGTPSTVNDTAVLSVSGVPAVALCIFEQSAPANPSVFGDGLGCIGAGMIRIATKSATAGAVSYPVGSELALHNKGGVSFDGGTYGYQAWYRNSASFCTSAAFNITNGVLIRWAR